MFWKKTVNTKKKPVDTDNGNVGAASTRSANEDRESTLDDALDTLAVVLRAAGDAAADVHLTEKEKEASSGKNLFEAWAQHLLVMAPPPGSEPSPDTAQSSSTRHDWGGLRRSVRDYLSKEGTQVKEALSGFKDALKTLMIRISKAVVDDEGTDQKAIEQLEKLRSVAEHGSVAEIRRSVLSAVDEIGSLLDERKTRQRAMARELGDRVKCLSLELEEAKKDAATDPLTGLDNRAAFDFALARASDQHTLFGEQSCLMMLDIDHFKKVNDDYGHPTGDAVLRALSLELSKCFPRKGDCVARYGGEEFSIVLRDSDIHDGERLAERVLKRVQEKVISHEGRQLLVTVSIGIAVSSAASTPESWLKRADDALYHAKHTGRARVCVDLGETDTGQLHA